MRTCEMDGGYTFKINTTSINKRVNNILPAPIYTACHADAASPPKEGRHPFTSIAGSRSRLLLRRSDRMKSE